MSAGAITGAGLGTSSTGSGFSTLGSDEFIKIMISELTHQDPFKPQDSSALLEQMSSLRNIESQLSLQEKLESLVLQNQLSSAGGLIGKVIEGLDANNNDVTGLVTSVRVENGKAVLELDSGKQLAMDRVTRISELQP